MEAVFVRRLPVVVAVDRSRRAAPAVAGRRGGRTGESLVIEREKIVLVEAPHLLVMRQRDDISRGRWRRLGSASVGSSGSVEPRDPRRLWGKGVAGRPAAVEAAPVRQLPIAVAADGSRRARPAVAGRPASKGLVIVSSSPREKASAKMFASPAQWATIILSRRRMNWGSC